MPSKQKTIYERAVSDTKTIQTLAEKSAERVIAESLAPVIREALNKGLAEAEEDPEAPVEEPPAEAEDKSAEGGEGKTVIDLDKLESEMEDTMKKEADSDLDLDVEDEDEEVEAPVEEADDEGFKKLGEIGEAEDKPAPKADDEEELQVSDEEIKEAYNQLVKEFDTPDKDGEPIDANTGKATGLAAEQKPQTGKPWNDVEPPEKEDAMKKEHYLRLLAKATRKLAESNKQVKVLAGKIQEMRLDYTKLSLITELFAKYPHVDRSVKEGIIARFDDVHTVREAKILAATAKSILTKGLKESHTVRRPMRPSGAPTGSTTAPRTEAKQLNEHAVAARYRELAKCEK